MLAGFLAVQASTSLSQQFDPPTYTNDPRLLVLKQFFTQRESPVADLSGDFLLAADRNKLDWRLLPSISIVESGGGKMFRNNNILGWDSCQQEFSSVRDCIHAVAARLAHSELYKNKNLDQKLATYNPDLDYPPLVKSVMARIGPESLLPPETAAADSAPYSSSRTPKYRPPKTITEITTTPR